MTVHELIAELEASGGSLTLEGERVICDLPDEFPDEALDKLRAERDEVKRILRERNFPPKLPRGVHLVAFELKPPPVILTRCTVVTNVPLFIETTLKQLAHALAGGNSYQSGNWSVRELLDRLEQVGLKLELDD